MVAKIVVFVLLFALAVVEFFGLRSHLDPKSFSLKHEKITFLIWQGVLHAYWVFKLWESVVEKMAG